MSRSFDGVDDLINCGTTVPTLNNGCTGIAWINAVDAGEGGTGRIFQKHTGSSARGHIAFSVATATIGISFTFNGGVNNSDLRAVDNSIIFGKWEAIAFTFDGTATASNHHIYINLKEPAYKLVTNGSGSIETDVDNQFWIGNRTGTDRTFKGKIAYAQMFNVQLQLSEITQATYFPGSIRRGLIGFWPLWGSSLTESDLSGLKNNGAVTGALSSLINPQINGIFQVPKPELIGSF